jgi:hypothetical protein
MKINIVYHTSGNDVNINIYHKEPTSSDRVVRITNENDELVYGFTINKIEKDFIDKNFFHFCKFNTFSKNITISIYQNEVLVFSEFINLKSKYGVEIQAPTLIVAAEKKFGLGDSFSTQPVIRKLNKIFQRRVNVYSPYESPFLNNPHVNQFTRIDDNDTVESVKRKNKNNPNFWEIGHYKFVINREIDFRDNAANLCQTSLSKKEKYFEFYPNPKKLNFDLPDRYILIYPRKVGPDRDLGKDKWQELVDRLNVKNIPVVVIGLSSNYGKLEKDHHDLNVKIGVNLCGKLDIDPTNEFQISSEIWHLINKSFGIITFPTSAYVLSSTTDTNIFLISSYFNNDLWNPYRNGVDDYKLFNIHGSCFEQCINNLKYYVNEHAKISQFRVQTCPLNKNFSCIPSVEKIVETVVEKYYQQL